MPPIPITFHTHPPPSTKDPSLVTQIPASQWGTYPYRRNKLDKNARKSTKPIYISYHTREHKESRPIKSSTTTKEPTKTQLDRNLPSFTPSSTSASTASSTTPVPSTSKRRKTVFKPLTPGTKYITLTPLLQPIVMRCILAAGTSNVSGEVSPTKLANGTKPKTLSKKSNNHVWPVVHPYNRLTDLANTRSTNPSPREIARSIKAEEMKIKARKESAAAARAASAGKRGRGRGGAKSKAPESNGNGSTKRKRTRSASPLKSGTATPGQNGEDTSRNPGMIITESITDEPVGTTSSASAPLGLSSRVGLKRTRSGGMLSISSTTANALSGAGAFGLGSPLRAVMGPEGSSSGDEEADSSNGEREKKKSRLGTEQDHLQVQDPIGFDGVKPRRAASHSPSSGLAPLPVNAPSPQPNTFPISHPTPLPRRGSSNSGVAGRTAALLEGGTGMRRAVSSTGGGGGRSRREVTLPGRLRDYDIRAGGAVV